MKNLHQFILEKSALDGLEAALQEEFLEAKQVGAPKDHAEGIEQAWICSDKSGRLFSFGTCEVNDKNVLGVKSGAVYLVVGPPERGTPKRTRKEVADGFERFERALVALGARRRSS